MKKLLIILLIFVGVSAFVFPGVCVYETHASLNGYHVFRIEYPEGLCDVGINDSGDWLVECGEDGVLVDSMVQKLPDRLQNGYWIFIFDNQKSTCAIAYNPDVDCNLFIECGLFE